MVDVRYSRRRFAQSAASGSSYREAKVKISDVLDRLSFPSHENQFKDQPDNNKDWIDHCGFNIIDSRQCFPAKVLSIFRFRFLSCGNGQLLGKLIPTSAIELRSQVFRQKFFPSFGFDFYHVEMGNFWVNWFQLLRLNYDLKFSGKSSFHLSVSISIMWKWATFG